MYRMRLLLLRTLFAGVFPAFIFIPILALAQAPTSSGQPYEDAISNLLRAQTQLAPQISGTQQSTVGNYLDVKIDPPIPGPNTSVNITIESYLTDLYKANISWSLNGKVSSRGIGRTAFSFQNGPSGKTTTVSLSIITNTGEVISKVFSFTPVGVTIMWVADTYTPPFYKGKSLLSPQANVRIVAVPDVITQGKPLGTSNLVYNWSKDGQLDTASSGYGKNVFLFIGPKPLSNTKITLDVSSLDDSSQSAMQIYLPQARPFILFYEKDPLLGVLYNKPFNEETTLGKKEFSLSAEPYYFSNEAQEGGIAPTLKYVWSVNGSPVQNYGRTITLRNDTGSKGNSLISLAMRGIIQTFQSAKRDLKVNFTETSDSAHPTF